MSRIGHLPCLLLALALLGAACGGGAGGGAGGTSATVVASGPPAMPPRPGVRPWPAPSRAITGVQTVLVVAVSTPGNPAPFPAAALTEAMRQADAIIRANSGGLASLSAEFLDLAVPASGDNLTLLALAITAMHSDMGRFRHMVLVTRGPSASYGSQGLINGLGVVWQSKPDDDPRWTSNIAPAIAHELGHNWGFAHTATGLMSGAAGDDLTFSAEQRHSVGWP